MLQSNERRLYSRCSKELFLIGYLFGRICHDIEPIVAGKVVVCGIVPNSPLHSNVVINYAIAIRLFRTVLCNVSKTIPAIMGVYCSLNPRELRL